MIFTFYSYKGGVGRSMALANVAAWYCARGLRVLMVDWDLEAPGLEVFFEGADTGDAGARAAPGLIDLLESYKRLHALLDLPVEVPAKSQGATLPSSQNDLLRRLEESLPPITGFLYPLSLAGGLSSPGELHLLSAGWRSGDRFSQYVSAVQSFDWTDFYRSFHGELYFEWLRRQLLRAADVVLIDSRTGVTEMGGVCTRQLADTVVCLCAPNFQNLQGLLQVLRSFEDPELKSARGERRLWTVVVPARLDNSETDLRNRFEAEFKREIRQRPPAFEQHGIQPWDLRLPYVPKYSYQEMLVIGAPDRAQELADAYERLASRLALLAPASSRLRTEIPLERTAQILQPADRPAELVLELTDPRFVKGSQDKVEATATLSFIPANERGHPVRSRRFRFVSPLGAREAEDLSWYLSSYAAFPLPAFHERAERLVARFPHWGERLLAELRARQNVEIVSVWLKSAKMDGAALLTVNVDPDPPADGSPAEAEEAGRAAIRLLALPWELLANERGPLLEQGVRWRRTVPRRVLMPQVLAEVPIRILLLSPRPDAPTEYLDHRLSAMPLVESLSELRGAAELSILRPPTFKSLEYALEQATFSGRPYHVVHFDGHGLVDEKSGSTMLVLETEKSNKEEAHLVSADQLAELLHAHRVPLVFLEACHTGVGRGDAPASAAAKLLDCGVGSVIAMRWAVRQDTAKKFVTTFYQALTRGSTIGEAVAAGQRRLRFEPQRGWSLAGSLELHDWFVPMLFQSDADTRLLDPSQIVPDVACPSQLRLGALPPPPQHGFVGRSRELLAAERCLQQSPSLALVGMAGIGKSAVATELARWLVLSGAFQRVLFADLAACPSPMDLLVALVRQLDSDVSPQTNEEIMAHLCQEVARCSTLIVLDGVESLVEIEKENTLSQAGVEHWPLLGVLLGLAQSRPDIRLCLVSRSPLPSSFASDEVHLGGLSDQDAIELQIAAWTSFGIRPRTNPEASQRLATGFAHLLNGHPVGLLLAAKHVARTAFSWDESLQEVIATGVLPVLEELTPYLPKDLESRVARLCVFRGRALLLSMAHVLQADEAEARDLAQRLDRTGFAQLVKNTYLLLHPGLMLRLRKHFDEEGLRSVEQDWARMMMALTRALLDALSGSSEPVADLITFEEPNLLGALEWTQAHPELFEAAEAIEFASSLEQIFSSVGAVEARERAAAISSEASEKLGSSWSHAAFLSLAGRVEQSIQAGRADEALKQAFELFQHTQKSSPEAYPDAELDMAVGLGLLGRALRNGGRPAEGLQATQQALVYLESLAGKGDPKTSQLLSATLSEAGQCMYILGRFAEAGIFYQRAGELDRELGASRNLAVDLANLANVHRAQGRLEDALDGFHESLRLFERTGEIGSAASLLHQLGQTYEQLSRFEDAEAAYQSALRWSVKLGSRLSEALTLGQLGSLYHRKGHLEEAVSFHQQTANIYKELGDPARQAIALHNLGALWLDQDRPAEAKRCLIEALRLGEPFSSTLEPWKTWAALQNAEEELGNEVSAQEARRKAIDAYVAYRRAGGQTPWGTAVEQLAKAKEAGIPETSLDEWIKESMPIDQLKSLIASVDKILAGPRSALSEDSALNYFLAGELEILKEKVERSRAPEDEDLLIRG